MEYFFNIAFALFLVVYGFMSELQTPFNEGCAVEKGASISRRLDDIKLPGGGYIRFLGTNGNHHNTVGYLKEIDKPFVLIFFDAHSDSTPYYAKLKCGNWVNFALEECPNLRRVIVIGVSKGLQFEDAGLWTNYALVKSGKFTMWPAMRCRSYFKDSGGVPESVKKYAFRWEDDKLGALVGHPGYYVVWNTFRNFKNELAGLDSNVYLSFDLDVLKEVKTPYGNGAVSLPELLDVEKVIVDNNRVIGADVCGTDDPSSDRPVEEIIKCLRKS
jgi:arginase family enzyme